MTNKWIKPLSLILAISSIMISSGCSVIAQNRWEGRDAQEALNFFGRPDTMKATQSPDAGTLVVMTWYKSSQWSTTEAAGTSLTPGANGLTYTEYYENVGHSSDCTLEATVNKARKIVLFKIQNGEIFHGKCQNIPYVPPSF
ncbi:hypothetical protein JFV28_28045 [Pseudomonas sp. TH05]|uniref:hypothetical protein n=1 Tax=unclassified Pseudomonas TaxID=196821 RepID=UPI000998013A|nr:MULTISPECIES: hypothetical protein [unclassified Pseudomonas]MBK5542152.1 hypothetical protein [Pseudomonas sp. TH07]MBK5559674.1 hypothetical protein [Pseudomonas sp. TH05]OOW00464.1 hypothetical protein MF4836_00685 [Pseudomonas sp. MF4836]